MKKILHFINLALLCALASTAYAIESPWYEVEILVFEQSDVNRLNSENWDQQIPLVDTKQSIDFISEDPSLVNLEQICLNGSMREVKEMIPFSLIEGPKEVTKSTQGSILETVTGILTAEQLLNVEADVVEEVPFKILNKKFNQLNDLATTIRRGRGFRPLMHITWRQPVDSKSKSRLIRLYTGKNYSDTFNPEGDARVDIASYIPDAPDNADGVSDSLREDNSFQGSFVESAETSEFKTYNQINDNSFEIIEPQLTEPELTEQDKIKQQLNNCQQLQQEIAAKQHQNIWQVDGNIRLYVERYLHLETDLMLRLPGKVDIQLRAIETSLAADKLLNNLNNDINSSLDGSISSSLNSPLSKKSQSSEAGFGWQLGDNILSNEFLTENQDSSVIQQDVLNKYSMQQSRRMRSNDIHYIDHPLFGILIEIRPYDKDADGYSSRF